MQSSWSYIRDSEDFIDKTNEIKNIPEDAILVTTDVIGLYPCIPHDAGLKALKNALDERENKSIPTKKLLKMAEFALKNNVFEFKGKVKEMILGTAIGTKCTPSYACIFMSKFETSFVEYQQNKPLVWFRHIDDIFFIWTRGEDKLKTVLEYLNSFDPSLKFTHESNKESLPFLDLKVNCKPSKGKISTDLYVKDAGRHQYLRYT